VILTLAHIGARFSAADEFEKLTRLYLERLNPFAPCDTAPFRDESSLFNSLSRQADRQSRRAGTLVLLDSRGKQLTSEAFAAWLGRQREDGVPRIVFAIGPASGWSDNGRSQAHLLLSLGSLTLAHALARLVLAEQLYRASTILTGHPYHTGH
jgi:23S rRNA (pseudouridine1915-N3)-methyltransferase